MALLRNVLFAAVGLGLIFTSAQAWACFSIVVGKDASTTGEVLIGHNEDNDRKIVMAQYYVPRMKHKDGTLIQMEPFAAKIPQVPETYSYYWTQTLGPDGYSFSDGFINEYGVAIVSDNCVSSKEDKPDIKNGGIGYGIRRIMAERAKTAREAVNIAIDLLNNYGYFHPGRSYQIADKNEAWMLQVVKGNHYVARRIANNEIAVISNAFTMTNVDMNDTENYIASKDLITYAIDRGWYKPAKKGKYDDFNFRKAYQDASTRAEEWNSRRIYTALKYFTGKEFSDPESYPFTITLDRKVDANDLKAVLRGHYEAEKRDNGFFHQNMDDICNISTQESVVIQMRKDPRMILAQRASGHPCINPYVPIYPLAGVPSQQNWMTPTEAQNQHFKADGSNFSYDPSHAFWTFISLQNLLNFRYEDAESAQKASAALERLWDAELASAEKTAVYKATIQNPNALNNFLYNFNVEKAMQAKETMAKVLREVNIYDFSINEQKLSQSDKGTVETVLYSNKDFDATKIDIKKTLMGIAHSNGDDELHTDLAKPTEHKAKDVNGDGVEDMVITFKIQDVLKITFPDVRSDLYLFTYEGSKKITAFDSVLVTK